MRRSPLSGLRGALRVRRRHDPPADGTPPVPPGAARHGPLSSIRAKVLTAFAAALIALATVSWVALARYDAMRVNSRDVGTFWLPGAVANARMLTGQLGARLFLGHSLMPEDEHTRALDRATYAGLVAAVDANAQAYRTLLANKGGNLANMEAFGEQWNASKRTEAAILDLWQQPGQQARAIALFQSESRIPARIARAHLQAELEYNANNGVDLAKRNARINRESEQLLLLVVLAAGGLCGLGVLLIGRSVLTPLHQMTLATIRVAGGDHSAVIPGVGRRDEVGDLADALAVLRTRSAERDRLLAQLTRERAALATAKQQADAHVAALSTLQGQLVESEKLAALGALVAGVAHEVNSPLGVAVSAASTLQGAIQTLLAGLADGTLRQSGVSRFSTTATDSLSLLERNLERATSLIQQFKQVAVDRTSSQRRQFDLREIVGETLSTLAPLLRRANFAVVVDVPHGIILDSYPGPLGQVLTNLVQNAKLHAFETRGGTLRFSATLGQDPTGRAQVRLALADDGAGMSDTVRRRLFEPFFTTKLGQGGSGLGMHIVYNIVTGILGGGIEVTSNPGAGTTITLILPSRAPDETPAVAPETVQAPPPTQSAPSPGDPAASSPTA